MNLLYISVDTPDEFNLRTEFLNKTIHMSTFAQYLEYKCFLSSFYHAKIMLAIWIECVPREEAGVLPAMQKQPNNNEREKKKVGNLANLFVAKISFDKFNVSKKKEKSQVESVRTDHWDWNSDYLLLSGEWRRRRSTYNLYNFHGPVESHKQPKAAEPTHLSFLLFFLSFLVVVAKTETNTEKKSAQFKGFIPFNFIAI